MRNKLKDPKFDNYFIDITYHIISNVFKHYKLMTITCVDNDAKNIFITELIFLNFEYNISFTKYSNICMQCLNLILELFTQITHQH